MKTTVILAGGKGVRMGGNKPLHTYEGTTLIEATLARLKPQTPDIAINAGTGGSAIALSLEHLGLPLIFDSEAHAGLGPLSGVLSALTYAEKRGLRSVITVPCDMPRLPSDTIEQLLQNQEADIVHFSGTDDYPLCALWQTSLRTDLEAALSAARANGGLSVRRYLSAQSVRRIKVADDRDFININSTDLPTHP